MDQHSKLGYREGLVSVILNLLLFVLKYYAGIASASLALIADAWHTLFGFPDFFGRNLWN